MGTLPYDQAPTGIQDKDEQVKKRKVTSQGRDVVDDSQNQLNDFEHLEFTLCADVLYHDNWLQAYSAGVFHSQTR